MSASQAELVGLKNRLTANEKARAQILELGWEIRREPEPGRRTFFAYRKTNDVIQADFAPDIETLYLRVSKRPLPSPPVWKSRSRRHGFDIEEAGLKYISPSSKAISQSPPPTRESYTSGVETQ